MHFDETPWVENAFEDVERWRFALGPDCVVMLKSWMLEDYFSRDRRGRMVCEE